MSARGSLAPYVNIRAATELAWVLPFVHGPLWPFSPPYPPLTLTNGPGESAAAHPRHGLHLNGGTVLCLVERLDVGICGVKGIGHVLGEHRGRHILWCMRGRAVGGGHMTTWEGEPVRGIGRRPHGEVHGWHRPDDDMST